MERTEMDQTEILMQILICLEDIKREQAVQTKLLDAAIRFAGDFNSQYSGDRHRAPRFIFYYLVHNLVHFLLALFTNRCINYASP